MQRRCSNCIHSQFEGYCGQMAVCDEWERRKPYAEILPTQRQIEDDRFIDRQSENGKAKKSSRRKTNHSSSSRKKKSPTNAIAESNVHRMRLETNRQRKAKRIKKMMELVEPIHSFPKKGCTKEQVLVEVRGWCRDHGYSYDDRYEDEPMERLISRFLCNELSSGGRKTGNYLPDPAKMDHCFKAKPGKALD